MLTNSSTILPGLCILNYIVKKVDYIIVKSEEMKNSLSANKEISVVPNGVDLDFFNVKDSIDTKQKLGFQADDFLILFLLFFQI